MSTCGSKAAATKKLSKCQRLKAEVLSGINSRVDSTGNWRHKDLTDLKTNEESISHDYGRKGTTIIVGWLRKLKVEESEEGAKITDECATHGDDGARQTVIDQSVDTTVFHHSEEQI